MDEKVRATIRSFLRLEDPISEVKFHTCEVVSEGEYDRILVRYQNEEGQQIPAFLLIPHGRGPFPAVLVLHQHNGQRHMGKSEVCGLAGDPLQAFGPALARRGFVVLAPDSICFEDRRTNRTGVQPDDDADWLQHYNEMSYRLVRGDTLMRRVLQDSVLAISLLYDHPKVDPTRIGALGHSYGGNTVLFLAALDPRIAFSCSSGAACTYATKMKNGTGIEMAELIPGVAGQFDVTDLVKCIAPRRLLIVSATEDKYSNDADAIVDQAKGTFALLGAENQLKHNRYDGGHAISEHRFNDILRWLSASAGALR
jgi:dienelactone hydrolase